MAKVNDLGEAEYTLLGVDNHTVGLQQAEDGAEIIGVGGLAAAGDKNVVQVDEDERQAAADHVHESLKSLGRVLEPKRHA